MRVLIRLIIICYVGSLLSGCDNSMPKETISAIFYIDESVINRDLNKKNPIRSECK